MGGFTTLLCVQFLLFMALKVNVIQQEKETAEQLAGKMGDLETYKKRKEGQIQRREVLGNLGREIAERAMKRAVKLYYVHVTGDKYPREYLGPQLTPAEIVKGKAWNTYVENRRWPEVRPPTLIHAYSKWTTHTQPMYSAVPY